MAQKVKVPKPYRKEENKFTVQISKYITLRATVRQIVWGVAGILVYLQFHRLFTWVHNATSVPMMAARIVAGIIIAGITLLGMLYRVPKSEVTKGAGLYPEELLFRHFAHKFFDKQRSVYSKNHDDKYQF